MSGMREAALLRALGATRKQLSQAQWVEFILVGSLAGLILLLLVLVRLVGCWLNLRSNLRGLSRPWCGSLVLRSAPCAQ